MADIFLSYKKEDRRHAERVANALHARGWSVWWDDGLTPHEAWDRTIEKQIADARAVVVLWTPRSVTSDWVRSEALYAQDHGKLLPVIMEACEIPLAFMLRQAVDLSKSRLDLSDAHWCRFLEWVEEIAGHPGEPQPFQNVSRIQPVRKIGRFGAVGIATSLSVVVLAAVAWLTGLLAPAPARPDVVVDDFKVSGRIAPDFAADLKDELFTSLNSSSLIQPEQGNGGRKRSAYQITGRVDSEGKMARAYLQVFAPGIDAPVLTTSLERPIEQKSAARTMALELSMAVRCIATASDSSGSVTAVLPKQAIAPWARFCNETEIDHSDSSEILATLRQVTAAAPNFANGWSNLAEQEFEASEEPDAEKTSLRADARRSIERALKLDQRSAKALMVKAWLVVGLGGPDEGTSNFPHFQNFDEFDRLVAKATTVRPSDCGCELIQYGFLLRQFGRPSAALVYFKRGAIGQTGAYEAELEQAVVLAQIGRNAEAESRYAKLVDTWPDVLVINQARLSNAIWRGDWNLARRLASEAPTDAASAAKKLLIDALATRNADEHREALTMLRKLVSNPATLNPDNIQMLAMAGDGETAIAAVRRLIVTNPSSAFIFNPSFSAARKTPEFAQLASDMNLIPYWRMPGHRPDFCAEPDPPALCRKLH